MYQRARLDRTMRALGAGVSGRWALNDSSEVDR